MSRTFRHVNYEDRIMSPLMRHWRRLAELGYMNNTGFWQEDIRSSRTMGYDGKPRSYLWQHHIKDGHWRESYCHRNMRKFVKRSACKYRRRQPIEIQDD